MGSAAVAHRRRRSLTGGVVVALLILSGCAGRLPLPMSASDSSDTGASARAFLLVERLRL